MTIIIYIFLLKKIIFSKRRKVFDRLFDDQKFREERLVELRLHLDKLE